MGTTPSTEGANCHYAQHGRQVDGLLQHHTRNGPRGGTRLPASRPDSLQGGRTLSPCASPGMSMKEARVL